MARSSAIQGFLVTGDTLYQLCEEVPDVIQALYEVCRAQGWAFIKDVPDIQPQDIIWLTMQDLNQS